MPPFTSSLMIGAHAVAEDHSLTIDTNELDDARWFTREGVAAALAADPAAPFLPPPRFAIAATLMSVVLGIPLGLARRRGDGELLSLLGREHIPLLVEIDLFVLVPFQLLPAALLLLGRHRISMPLARRRRRRP